jgi:hypothetical protein
MPEQKSLKQRLENVTLDGRPIYEIVEQEVATEIEKTSKQEISEKSIGINPKITTKFNQNISGSKSERRDLTKSCSQETLADMNYQFQVQNSQGGKPVEASTLLQLPQQGSIEIALDDARKKAKFFLAEKARIEAEYDRWNTVATQLEATLALVTGKAVQPREGRIRVVGKGHWATFIFQALTSGPMPRKDLISYLQSQGAPTSGAAYQAVRQQERNGTIRLIEGKRYERVIEEKEEHEN